MSLSCRLGILMRTIPDLTKYADDVYRLLPIEHWASAKPEVITREWIRTLNSLPIPVDFTPTETRIRPTEVWSLLDQVTELSEANPMNSSPCISLTEADFTLLVQTERPLRHYLMGGDEQYERISEELYQLHAPISKLRRSVSDADPRTLPKRSMSTVNDPLPLAGRF